MAAESDAVDARDSSGEDWAWAAKVPKQLVAGVALLWQGMVQQKDTGATENDERESLARAFDADTVPTIAVEVYVQRFADYANPGLDGLVLAVLLTTRFLAVGAAKGAAVTEKNVHRLIASAVLVSGKLALERYYSNTFLAALDYDVAATPSQLAAVLAQVRQAVEVGNAGGTAEGSSD